MVVAETWAEQKVLMRAFATCLDQTQPTIGLQGEEIAIGPAGTEPYGPWGVHVQPPADGRAQELRVLLEQAAKHLAGTKGTPPRLADELPASERRPTTPWTGRRGGSVVAAGPEQPTLSPVAPAGSGSYPSNVSTPPWRSPIGELPTAPGASAAQPLPQTSPRQRRHRQTRPAPLGGRTVSGYAEATTPVAERRSYHHTPQHASLATVVGKTMPIGFQLAADEREVLDALSRGGILSGGDVARLAGVDDGHDYMGRLLDKLAGYGLDLVDVTNGVYRLRRT